MMVDFFTNNTLAACALGLQVALWTLLLTDEWFWYLGRRVRYALYVATCLCSMILGVWFAFFLEPFVPMWLRLLLARLFFLGLAVAAVLERLGCRRRHRRDLGDLQDRLERAYAEIYALNQALGRRRE